MCPAAQSKQEADRSEQCIRGATATRKLLYKSSTGIALALLSPAVLAAQEAVVATVITIGPISVFILFVILVVLGVYSMGSRDK
jgi:hypothetical protein